MTTSPAFQHGLVFYQQGRVKDAADRFREVLAGEPDHARAHAMLALCLQRDEELIEATAEAQRAIGIDPELPLSFYSLAVTMVRRNRDDEARTALESAISLDRTEPNYHALLAQLYLRKSLWRMALHAADDGLLHDPRHSGCLNARSNALVNLGDREAAAATVQDALQEDPEDAWLHANRGWALLHEGKPREAMTHFREALRLDPENHWARAGIVESLKASFFVYRWLLRYFLWMSRFSPRTQNVIVIGGFVAYRALQMLSREVPILTPVVLPLLIAYALFALLTWLASILLNLLLRLHPVGKYALSWADRRSSELVGLLLLLAIGCVLASLATWSESLITLGLTFFATSLSASQVFYVASGWPRWLTAGVVLTVLSLGIYASVDLRAHPFYNFVTASLLSQFAVMFLIRARPRR